MREMSGLEWGALDFENLKNPHAENENTYFEDTLASKSVASCSWAIQVNLKISLIFLENLNSALQIVYI